MVDATERITIGSAIMPCMHAPPVVHAREAMYLQQLSDGRFILGMGSQTKGQIRMQLGIEDPKPAIIGKEVLTLVRALMNRTEAPLRFKGEYFSVNLPGQRSARSDHGVQPPPLYYSGLNRINLRLSGELSDGLVAHPIFTVRYFNEYAWPLVDEGLRRSGKARADFDMVAMPMLYIVDNDSEWEEAYRRCKRNLAMYFTTRAYGTYLDQMGWTDVRLCIEASVKKAPYGGPFNYEELEQCIPTEVAEEVCLIGTREQVLQKARERYEGLVDTMLLYVVGDAGASGEPEYNKKEEQMHRVLETFKSYKRG